MLRLFAAHEFRDGGHDVGVAAGAQHTVHLGQLRPDVVGVPLSEAAGDQQLFQLALRLELPQLQNVVDGLALGRLDEAAGVKHRHVRALRLAGDNKARRPAQGHHLLGVYQILGAAKRDKRHLI